MRQYLFSGLIHITYKYKLFILLTKLIIESTLTLRYYFTDNYKYSLMLSIAIAFINSNYEFPISTLITKIERTSINQILKQKKSFRNIHYN